MKLPDGFTTRPPTTDDAQAVTDLIIACDIDEFGKPEWNLEDLRAMWRRKGFNPATDARIIFAPDGSVAGYMDMYDDGDIVRLNNNSSVHPRFKHSELGDWILDTAEVWAREHVDDRQIVLRHVVNAAEPTKVNRMVRHGFQAVRYAFIMHIELAQPPTRPEIPEGIVLRPFVRGQDDRLVWSCIQEAFRDLWQHKDSPFDEWSSFVLEHGAFSPQLSYVALDDQLVVGATITMNDSLGGWVQQVAVRRPWRGRGIGLALLDTVFGELYKIGVPHAGLEVDAENPSGALQLYQRAGMHVKDQFTEFRKELAIPVKMAV